MSQRVAVFIGRGTKVHAAIETSPGFVQPPLCGRTGTVSVITGARVITCQACRKAIEETS